MTFVRPRVHDLIRFDPGGLDRPLPDWVTRDRTDAWAVVRRVHASDAGMVAAGVRGRDRAQRAAIEVDAGAVLAIVSPESLVAADASGLNSAGIADALLAIAGSELFAGHRWGPTGSAGFQLATGLAAVHAESDLDLIIRADEPIRRGRARTMIRFFAALPCRVDCLLETRAGAVALTEWAATSGVDPVLLRTADGPGLTSDPWSATPAGMSA